MPLLSPEDETEQREEAVRLTALRLDTFQQVISVTRLSKFNLEVKQKIRELSKSRKSSRVPSNHKQTERLKTRTSTFPSVPAAAAVAFSPKTSTYPEY